MFPKWQNPGRKSGIVLTFLQIVCLSKAMPPAFILLEDVVLNEVYKEIVAPVEMWGRGAFPSGECHRSGKSVFGALQGFSCSSLGILLKSLRIQWLFWENFKLVTVLDVWVALFGFQSGFIGFFLFNSRSSTGPVGAAVGHRTLSRSTCGFWSLLGEGDQNQTALVCPARSRAGWQGSDGFSPWPPVLFQQQIESSIQ